MGWEAQIFPILIAGNTIIINGQGEFIYNGPPAAGNLIASFANSAGTDSEGNAYLAGIVSYNPVTFQALQMVNAGFIVSVAPSQAGPYATQEGTIGWDSTDGWVFLSPASTGTTAATFGGPIVLDTLAATPAPAANGSVLYTDVNGNLATVDQGDSQNYIIGTRVFATTATIPINLTTPIVIVNPHVGINTYEFEVEIIFIGNQALGSAVLAWGGGATISEVVGHSFFVPQAGAAPSNSQVFNGTLVAGTSPALGAANQKWAYYAKGLISFSSAGTFTVFGQESIAGDSWAVATGSYMKLTPVG
jgi:hypothetical protein